MRKLLLHISLFATLLLSFTGCKSDASTIEDDGAKYHWVINVKNPQYSTRAGEQINKDGTRYEDAVHSLAMLIFNSSTGAKVGAYFNNQVGSGVPATHAFSVKLEPGKYDFYFIANVANMQSELNGVANRNEMNSYLNRVNRELPNTLYSGATATVGIPMSRVYLKQNIAKGGTIYQPKPFKPKMLSTELDKVIANNAGNGTTERNWVELIRTVAKLEVEIEAGNGALGIDKIYFRNANRHYSLNDFGTATPTAYYSDNTNNVELKREGTTNKYYFYMPEALMPTTKPVWNEQGHNKPINYFTVVTTGGQRFNIPIISNDQSIGAGGNYMSKAKGTFAGYTPDYNIYRNHKYTFYIRNLQQLEVFFNVNPWNVVKTATYMGYGYNVDVSSDGEVTITNTMDDCLPHKVILKAKNGAYFGTPGTTEVTYGYEATTDAGYNVAKTKAGYSQTFNVNNNAVATGQPYLEVYYNKTPGASGVKPDKVFSK